MAHVAPWKTERVAQLVKEFQEASVIGVVGLQGIPGAQMQKIRASLRGRANLLVTKNTLVHLALKEAAKKRKGLEELTPLVGGQIALVTAKVNPFRLFRELESTKTRAPARGGEMAPEDILIREGDTPFKPGPIVGELQKAGIPAVIEGGRVVIRKEKLMVKKGERIPRELAQGLTRLEIYPLVVGLDVRGIFEEGTVYPRDILSVDEAAVLAQVQAATRGAFNLAVFAGYPTLMTIRPMIAQGFRKALSLAVQLGYPTKESVPLLLARAVAHGQALVRKLPPEAQPGGEKKTESAEESSSKTK